MSRRHGKDGPKIGLVEIFADGRTPISILLWAIYFIALTTLTLSFSWPATFSNQLSGWTLQQYAQMDLFSLVGGLLGPFTVGWLMD